MDWTIGAAALTATLMGMMAVTPAGATPQLFTDAKKSGMPAQNCQYCHVSKLPKKESFKPEDLNERGQWLAAEKDRQKAKDVKTDWLKAYPGGKEQK